MADDKYHEWTESEIKSYFEMLEKNKFFGEVRTDRASELKG